MDKDLEMVFKFLQSKIENLTTNLAQVTETYDKKLRKVNKDL
jgi:SPX domain protein involved in polyphosphate accumulation